MIGVFSFTGLAVGAMLKGVRDHINMEGSKALFGTSVLTREGKATC
jgi:hypothetical protein